jgi:hypothetical protein
LFFPERESLTAMSWLLWQYQDELGTLLLLGAFVLAMLRGGSAERVVALTLFCHLPLALIDLAVFGPRDPHTSYRALEPGLFAIDLILLALMTAVALRANRVYPLLIAAAQLIAVMAHVVRMVSGDLVPRTYASLVIAPAHFQILVLLVGTLIHIRREDRFGPYPSWRVRQGRGQSLSGYPSTGPAAPPHGGSPAHSGATHPANASMAETGLQS